jgi:anti-sigma B factor antagonist
MSVKLTTRKNGEVTIIDASGKLTLGEGTGALRTKIRELVDGGSKRIILNLADVTYMDSSGLGGLIAAHTTVTTAGGEMKLLSLAKRVHDLLKITKLYTVFEVFEDEASAVASFPLAKPADIQA